MLANSWSSTLGHFKLREKKKKQKKAPGLHISVYMFAPSPVPPAVRTIWSTTENDRWMMQVTRSQKKLRDRLDKHEEILKELLCFLSHESDVCSSRKGTTKSITD